MQWRTLIKVNGQLVGTSITKLWDVANSSDNELFALSLPIDDVSNPVVYSDPITDFDVSGDIGPYALIEGIVSGNPWHYYAQMRRMSA